MKYLHTQLYTHVYGHMFKPLWLEGDFMPSLHKW